MERWELIVFVVLVIVAAGGGTLLVMLAVDTLRRVETDRLMRPHVKVALHSRVVPLLSAERRRTEIKGRARGDPWSTLTVSRTKLTQVFEFVMRPAARAVLLALARNVGAPQTRYGLEPRGMNAILLGSTLRLLTRHLPARVAAA
jgi:hypothetical protein